MKNVTPAMAIALFHKSSLNVDFQKAMHEKCPDGYVKGTVLNGVINNATWNHEGRDLNVIATFCKAEGIRWADVDIRSDAFVKEVRQIAAEYLGERYGEVYTWERTSSSGKSREEVATADLAAAWA
jgi:hypothetical protein